MGRKSKRARQSAKAIQKRWRKKANSSAASIDSPLAMLANVAMAKENLISALETPRPQIVVDSGLGDLVGSNLPGGTRGVKVVDDGRVGRSTAQNDSGETRGKKRAKSRGSYTGFSERTEQRKRKYNREQKLTPITNFFKPIPPESAKTDSSVLDASQMKNYPIFSESKSRGVNGRFTGGDLTSKINEKVGITVVSSKDWDKQLSYESTQQTQQKTKLIGKGPAIDFDIEKLEKLRTDLQHYVEKLGYISVRARLSKLLSYLNKLLLDDGTGRVKISERVAKEESNCRQTSGVYSAIMIRKWAETLYTKGIEAALGNEYFENTRSPIRSENFRDKLRKELQKTRDKPVTSEVAQIAARTVLNSKQFRPHYPKFRGKESSK